MTMVFSSLNAHTFCDVLWQGQPRHFAVALVGGHLYFWDADGENRQYMPDAPLLVVLEQIKVSAGAIINPRFVYHAFQGDWDRICAREVPWGRIVPFDDKTDVLLHATGEGKVRRGKVWDAPFRLDSPLEILDGSTSHWKERLQQWNGDNDGDFAFSLRWTELDYDEQGQLLFQLSQGDWAEMKQAAQWLSLIEGDAEFARRIEHSGTYKAIEMALGCRLEGGQWSMFYDHYDREGDEAFRPLWQTWFDFFAPFVHFKIIERYTVASERVKGEILITIETPLEPRSAHEQMETRLQLRDWLRERVGLPDERITELLV